MYGERFARITAFVLALFGRCTCDYDYTKCPYVRAEMNSAENGIRVTIPVSYRVED